MKKLFYYSIVIGLLGVIITPVCQAVSLLDGSSDASLADFVALMSRAVDIMLGLVGVAALLAFVVGGVMMLISAGDKNLIDKGKNMIKAAIIGLVIVFLSFTIIKVTYRMFGLDWNGKVEPPKQSDEARDVNVPSGN